MLPRRDLLPGLWRPAEGLVVSPAPVHAGGGPLARPYVVGVPVPEGGAARGDDRQDQDPGRDAGAGPDRGGAHAGHHRRPWGPDPVSPGCCGRGGNCSISASSAASAASSFTSVMGITVLRGSRAPDALVAETHLMCDGSASLDVR